ncbi:hypothetical protein Bca101_055150 [Brassica carinata]
MTAKTRFGEKKNKEDLPEKKKNESRARKKDALKRREAAVKRRRDSAKKKKDVEKKNKSEMAKKKKNETAKKKRKRDSGVDGGSSSNPTKRIRNTASPLEHQGDHSPTPSAELPSQTDRECTPNPSLLSSSTKSPSHRVDEDEEIGSNNRDSHAPEAAIDNDAQRQVGEENAAVQPMRPVGFFFKPSEYGTVISSILNPQGREIDLLYEIMDEGTIEDVQLIDDLDKPDIAVDGWNRILIEPEGKIFWEDLFEIDVRTREQESEPQVSCEGHEQARDNEEPGESCASLRELESKLTKKMEEGFALRDETIRVLEARVKELEEERNQRENWSFQYDQFQTGGTSGGDAGKDPSDAGKDPSDAVVDTPLPTETAPDADKDTAYVDTPFPNEGETEAEKEDKTEAEKEDETEAEKEDETEAEKEGEIEAEKEDETEAEKEGETEAEKEGEEAEKEGVTEAEKEGEEAEKEGETEVDKMMEDDAEDLPSTLEVMAEAAEKFEKEAHEEETRPKRTHKPSRPLRSPYQPN